MLAFFFSSTVVCVQACRKVIPVPVTMLRPSSSRSHRSKKLRPSHGLQVFLFVAVGIWIVYQLTHSYGKRRVVTVETDGIGGEPARRRLGTKGSVDFAAGQASVGDVAGVGDGSDAGRGADSSDDPSSKAGDGDEEDDDQEVDEDDGVDSDAEDGLAADEEEDDRDLQSQDGSSEDELKTAHGETQKGLNTSIVPPVNATDTLQGGVAVLLANATGRTADGTTLTALKNPATVDLSSLHARGTAGDIIENKPLANIGSSGENRNLHINKNGAAADTVAGYGILS
ncbi:uncharacterized protein LOC120689945 isoform X2 [Panicum virgatum]|uniref:Uncharacterized protein n=1 Tax=Panicum virgatum TaxID=38727 RepID=A0A8T0MFM9_PANVG|nr:uncharacterized protein LOC120689945 isoform X2 [Panicum virgatum]KAG2534912.1 hypothetical protein PVAP13_9NG652619 [Panicum virgatum]